MRGPYDTQQQLPGVMDTPERPPVDSAANAVERWRVMLEREGGNAEKVIEGWAASITGHYGIKHNGGDTARQLAEAAEHDIPQARGLLQRAEEKLREEAEGVMSR
jgi:hypothetical protein